MTKTNIFNANKNRNKVKSPWQQVLTSLLRKKKKTSCKSNTSNGGERVITLINILKKGNRNHKTSVGLGKLYASDCS